MEYLQDMFGEGIDLAALASGAGLFGGGASAILVAFFHGVVKRFISQHSGNGCVDRVSDSCSC